MEELLSWVRYAFLNLPLTTIDKCPIEYKLNWGLRTINNLILLFQIGFFYVHTHFIYLFFLTYALYASYVYAYSNGYEVSRNF